MKDKNNLAFVLCIILLVGIPVFLVCSEFSSPVLQANILLAKRVVAGFAIAALLIGSYFLLLDDKALRDSSTAKDRPYSFARVQMWWWTIIVLGSFLGVYAASGNMWMLNATCLTLLGISSVTIAGARMIDNSQINDTNVTRHQDQGVSQDLVRDICRMKTASASIVFRR